MKAITIQRYGPPEVLELEEVERPVPKDDEVLVHVRASSANPRDWHLIRGLPYLARPQLGFRRPKWDRPGSDLAGVVEAVGASVTRFRPGDEVYADVESGGFSEYAAVPETRLARKPANLSFEEAAAVPLAAITALQGLRFGGIREGQRVLIVGASGGVGSFAVQLAKHLGAHVTGVASSRNVELVRSLGAERLVDYTKEDVTRSGGTYDLIFQLGGERSPRELRRVLAPKGTLVLSSGESRGRWVGPMWRMLEGMLLNPFVSQRVAPFMAKASAEDLEELTDLIEAGAVRPVIERTYPLAETREAMHQIETGHTRGKLVIEVSPAAAESGSAKSRSVVSRSAA
jgi:NADPH:quinone reductase-like Zn-dependent oxidoreductase